MQDNTNNQNSDMSKSKFCTVTEFSVVAYVSDRLAFCESKKFKELQLGVTWVQQGADQHVGASRFVVGTCIPLTAVAQWLRCCATNRKVAGSIPDGVIGIFH